MGQDKVIEEILIALFCRGHCLLVGVPGLAKTLLISTLAGIMELQFNRVQFTSDLMPSDITGTDILEEEVGSKRRSFRFIKGPIFTNILLADEINRTPPKTQAALLQAMQEYKVTAGGSDLSPRPSLLRPGHPEPHRTGRDLSVTRGAAGPVHVQHRHRLSSSRTGDGDRRHNDLLLSAGAQ